MLSYLLPSGKFIPTFFLCVYAHPFYNLAMPENEIVLNGRYRLIERVGSGGMAVVYKGQDLLLGRLVAVKMLHEGLTHDPDFLRRFRQEAYAAANLTHPNIVTVHDIGQDGNRHYIVMEYVDGRTLKQIVRENNQQDTLMSVERTLDLIIQVCAGIGYAHRANLVHCDVKPQNVIVTEDDRVKVADFGIARAVSEASQQYQHSQVWGTPQYFSPEQAAGQPATPASDVYAIGVMMFEMLTGRLPFTAETQAAMALKHLQERPPHVSDYNPAVPEQLELIIEKILSKEPAGRYWTAGQLGRILSTYRQNSAAETAVYGTTSIPLPKQQTELYLQREFADDLTQVDEMATAVAHGQPAQHVHATAAESPADWVAIGLGVLAVIALLGLIPLWYFVYLAYIG